MLAFIEAQKPIPMGGISGDEIHIWDEDLKTIDKILSDDRFIDILHSSIKRNIYSSTRRGRKRMALNRILRAGVLKHVKKLSFRDLFSDLKRNLDGRAFSQFFDEPVKSVASLSRNIACVDAQALHEMNELLCKTARDEGVIKGNVMRQDTTVCESNIHYPTDSSLLRDGVRVLQRLVKQAEDLVSTIPASRDRSRAATRRGLEIVRSVGAKENNEQKRKAYGKLLRITRAVVTTAKRAADKLGDGRATRHLNEMDRIAGAAVKDELETMAPRVEQVIRQTRNRVFRGITNSPNKLLSLFVPETFVIRKGKAHKPNEFGRVIDIVETENGFVSDYQVLDGNPNDGKLLIPAIQRHIERFGRPPRLAATDRGFWSAANEKAAYELGVRRVSIPAKGKTSKMRLRIQRSRWFRKAQRWRANGEGRIGILKNLSLIHI